LARTARCPAPAPASCDPPARPRSGQSWRCTARRPSPRRSCRNAPPRPRAGRATGKA
jgi:hypothetical protein